MIRQANRFDIDDIAEMFLDFAKDSTYAHLVPSEVQDTDIEHIKHVIFCCMHAGFVLIAEIDNEPVGFLVAIRQPNMWYPGTMTLQENVWYVKSQHRKTSIGGKLWLEYCRRAEEMIAQGQIDRYTTTRMNTTADINLEKRGFRLTEHLYIKGA